MAVQAIPKRLTLADYRELPETLQPTEIVNGELLVMPTPLPEHQRIVRRISLALEAPVVEAGIGEVFQSPLDVLIREEPLTTRQPDLFVVTRGELQRHPGYETVLPVRLRPAIIVEVLSPGNTPQRLRDLLADYEEIGVPEVWLVRPADRTVEVLALETGGYRSDGTYRGDEPIRSRELPDLRLSASRCFG